MSHELKYKCWCKATNREGSEPRYSQNWVASKRAWFKVYGDRIECGGWVIPFSEVKQAMIYNTRQMFIPVQVLQVVTEQGRFQFGFNPWASPFKYLALDMRQETIRLKYSPFSIVVRGLILGYLAYWVWDRWIKT
jgi:hypothetical protein